MLPSEQTPHERPSSEVRDAGITDLRYGNMLEEDWADKDRFELAGERRWPGPRRVMVMGSCIELLSADVDPKLREWLTR